LKSKTIEKAGGKVMLGRGVSVSHPSANVCSVYFENVSLEWETWILLTSDRHHDSKWCNRELEKSAKDGADSHDAKTAEKAKEKKDAKAKGSGKDKPAASRKKD